MRRITNLRTIIQFGLFVMLIAVTAAIFSNKADYAALLYPPIPDTQIPYINEAAKKCTVPLDKRGLIGALAWKESTFHPASQSGAGAKGVLQVLSGSGLFAAQKYGISGLNAATFHDARIGYLIGSCYFDSVLRGLTDDANPYHNDRAVNAALIAYNAGPARGRSFLNGSYNGPTSSLGYARRIMEAVPIYQKQIEDADNTSPEARTNALSEVRDLIWLIITPDLQEQ